MSGDITSCPLCGQTRARVLYRLGPADGIERRAVRCAACAFVYMAPRLTAAFLADYYAGAKVYAYGSEAAGDYANVIGDRVRLIRTMRAKAAGAPLSGRGVDFGAGVGTTVKALGELGYDAMGLEISARSRDTARDLFGVDMRAGSLDTLAGGSVALLTCFDVVEHLLDPVAFVESARAVLALGGMAIVGVPNFDALDRMLTGPRAKAMIFPEHVNYFTKTTLASLFASHGFKVAYVGSPPPYGVAFSLGLRAALMRATGRNALSLGLRDALTWIKRYLVYPAPNAFVEHTGLFGQSLLLVAQKRDGERIMPK